MNNDNAYEAAKTAVKAEAAGLLADYSKDQLAVADWLYVYAYGADDEQASKTPACRDLLEAQSRVRIEYDPYDDMFVDDMFRDELGLNAEQLRLGLTDELGRKIATAP